TEPGPSGGGHSESFDVEARLSRLATPAKVGDDEAPPHSLLTHRPRASMRAGPRPQAASCFLARDATLCKFEALVADAAREGAAIRPCSSQARIPNGWRRAPGETTGQNRDRSWGSPAGPKRPAGPTHPH